MDFCSVTFLYAANGNQFIYNGNCTFFKFKCPGKRIIINMTNFRHFCERNVFRKLQLYKID